MTIIAPGATAPAPEPATGTRRPAGGASGFTVPDSVEMAGLQGVRDVGTAQALNRSGSILALQEERGAQEVQTPSTGDREARRQGRSILEALADLQKSLLLAGGSPSAVLARLEALSGSLAPNCDPALAQLLGAIRLRARLEIARQERRGSGGEDAATASECMTRR